MFPLHTSKKLDDWSDYILTVKVHEICKEKPKHPGLPSSSGWTISGDSSYKDIRPGRLTYMEPQNVEKNSLFKGPCSGSMLPVIGFSNTLALLG